MNTPNFELGSSLLDEIVKAVPGLAMAVLVLISGLIIASLLGKIITKIAKNLHLDKILTTVGISDKLKESNVNLTLSGFLGWIVKWFIIVTTLLMVTDMLQLSKISEFLSSILIFLPNLLVAIVIITIGLVVGNFASELVEKSINTSDVIKPASARVLKTLSKWTIIFFAIMAALAQLEIAPDLINVLFTGIIFMFSLAGGLAFGLGGKEKAKELLERLDK